MSQGGISVLIMAAIAGPGLAQDGWKSPTDPTLWGDTGKQFTLPMAIGPIKGSTTGGGGGGTALPIVPGSQKYEDVNSVPLPGPAAMGIVGLVAMASRRRRPSAS